MAVGAGRASAKEGRRVRFGDGERTIGSSAMVVCGEAPLGSGSQSECIGIMDSSVFVYTTGRNFLLARPARHGSHFPCFPSPFAHFPSCLSLAKRDMTRQRQAPWHPRVVEPSAVLD